MPSTLEYFHRHISQYKFWSGVLQSGQTYTLISLSFRSRNLRLSKRTFFDISNKRTSAIHAASSQRKNNPLTTEPPVGLPARSHAMVAVFCRRQTALASAGEVLVDEP